MRILRINTLEGPHLGGAEQYIVETNRALRSRGHEARNLFLSAHTVQLDDPSAATFYRLVPPFGLPRVLRRAAGWAGDAEWINFHAQEFRPDIVHLHNAFTALPAIARFADQTAVPFVMTVHGSDPDFPIEKPPLVERILYFPWRGLFDRKVVPKVRAFICPSYANKSYLDAHGYRPTEMVRSFIQQPDNAPSHGPLTSPFRVGYIGRLETAKGLPELLHAWTELHRRLNGGISLDIAGAGPRHVPSGPGIILRGRVSGEEKDRWYSGIDVLIIPSRSYENLPLVAEEALARAIPVIASDNGGLREVLDGGRFGFLLPPGFHPAQLAESIEHVRDHYDEAVQRAKKGQEYVRQEFTEERHMERLLSIYEAVLQ